MHIQRSWYDGGCSSVKIPVDRAKQLVQSREKVETRACTLTNILQCSYQLHNEINNVKRGKGAEAFTDHDFADDVVLLADV